MVAALKLAKQHVVYAIPIAAIIPSPPNPRKTYNEQKRAELAESIKSNKGLIHPITVRAKAEDQYEIDLKALEKTARTSLANLAADAAVLAKDTE
jgi:hypothetical protein